jgi:hypothetical protein
MINQRTSAKAIYLVLICTSFAFTLFSCSPKRKAPKSNSLLERDDTVKTAAINMQVKSIQIIRDDIYNIIDSFDAIVEDEDWSDWGSLKESGSMDIRIPSPNFLKFVDYIKNTYKISGLRLSAHTTNSKSLEQGDVDTEGVVYSYVHLYLEKKLSYIDSFVVGANYASDALKISLQTIVPVVLFLIPYTLLCLLIIGLIVLGNRFYLSHKNIKNKKQSQP